MTDTDVITVNARVITVGFLRPAWFTSVAQNPAQILLKCESKQIIPSFKAKDENGQPKKD